MAADLLDAVRSLATLMEEETAGLVAPGPRPRFDELATAKVRLAAAIEAQAALRERERPDWLEALDPDERAELAQAFARLRAAAIVNADVLERQIDLCNDLMAAIAAAARRRSGTSAETYGAHGVLHRIDQATPVALNASI